MNASRRWVYAALLVGIIVTLTLAGQWAEIKWCEPATVVAEVGR